MPVGPTVSGAGAVPQQMTNPSQAQGRRVIPFRMATTERTEMLVGEAGTLTAAEQIFDRTIEGTGYISGIVLRFSALIASGNAATVVFAEDGPWSALSSVIYRDPTGEMVNLDGWSLYIANLGMRNYATTFPDVLAATMDTADPAAIATEFFQETAGAGATGGSFLFSLRVPLAINARSLLGLLGNQDRGVKYQLRTNVAGSGQIYGTAPTALQAFTIEKTYESFAVPAPVSAYGPQEYIPPQFGTLHFLTKNVSEAVPAANATLNHYLRRVGNMWRFMALAFRTNTRVLGQANVTRIQLKIGDTDFFNESYAYRRWIMYMRYGFRWPSGVLLYDWIHDFLPFAGGEFGDDWVNTKDVNTAQFIITYGAGVTGTTSLTFVSDDLTMVGQPLGT